MAEASKQKKAARTSKISARKRARQNLKHRERNRALLSQMRSQIKKLRTSLVAKNKKEAEALLKTALPIIARMASKKILHRNTAARYTSRLMSQFHSI